MHTQLQKLQQMETLPSLAKHAGLNTKYIKESIVHQFLHNILVCAWCTGQWGLAGPISDAGSGTACQAADLLACKLSTLYDSRNTHHLVLGCSQLASAGTMAQTIISHKASNWNQAQYHWLALTAAQQGSSPQKKDSRLPVKGLVCAPVDCQHWATRNHCAATAWDTPGWFTCTSSNSIKDMLSSICISTIDNWVAHHGESANTDSP